MDGFSYYNIFDTKGIEYLVVIAFLLLLIPFWLLLNKQVVIKQQFRKVIGLLSAHIQHIPQGVFHSNNHTWAYLQKSGVARIGLDELLLHITGEVTIKQLLKPGDAVKKGDLLAEMEQNGKNLNIYSPISGEVLSTNAMLSENREWLKDDPYGKGWVYNLKPTDWVADITSCHLANDATNWLQREMVRYKDFLAVKMPQFTDEKSLVVLQDGGELAENSLAEMPDEVWKAFQNDFLTP